MSEFIAYCGDQLVARGTLLSVAIAMQNAEASSGTKRMALYRESTGQALDLDLSGTEQELEQRLARFYPEDTAVADPGKRGKGRPKLGVVSREVSLLPRHWEWLSQQNRSASATLRRLVENARQADSGAAKSKQVAEVVHRFIWDLVGDQPGFEEASRALFALDLEGFRSRIADWPPDVVTQIERYLEALEASDSSSAR
ncbi:MAG: DUF2239 family protein [Myxococcota bacterium]